MKKGKRVLAILVSALIVAMLFASCTKKVNTVITSSSTSSVSNESSDTTSVESIASEASETSSVISSSSTSSASSSKPSTTSSAKPSTTSSIASSKAPNSNAVITVNDSVIGDGVNQFQYCTAYDATLGTDHQLLDSDNHYTWHKNYFYNFTFQGTQIEMYADEWNFFGQEEIDIDGAKVATIDQWSPTTVYQKLIYTSPVLAAGKHVLHVVNLGLISPKNTLGNNGTCVSIDYIKVYS